MTDDQIPRGRIPKRIVLTTFGSFGDLHPYMSIALEWQRRGGSVVIATSEYYRAKIQAEGIEFAPVCPDMPATEKVDAAMAKVFDLRNGPEYIVREMMMPCLRSSFQDLMAAAAGADLVVTHPLTFSASLAAEKLGIPWVSSVLSPLSFFSIHDPPVLPPVPFVNRFRGLGPSFYGPLFRLMRYVTGSWTKPVQDLRRELGLPASIHDPMFEGQFSSILNLALFSSALAKPQPDWLANTVQTGFPFYDRQESETGLSSELGAFLDAGPPPIVFTLGSAAVMDAGSFYRESLEAARQLGRRAILLIGTDRRNLPAGSPREDIAIFEYAPYSQLFPRSAAIVHQGGVGTTAQAMRAGRPMLVVPYGFDQPDNAERVARLGIARVILRKRYTARRASDSLRELLANSDYSRKAAEVGQLVLHDDGASVACDALENVVYNPK